MCNNRYTLQRYDIFFPLWKVFFIFAFDILNTETLNSKQDIPNMAVTIKQVTCKKDLKAFVDFPNKLYKGDLRI